MNINDELPGTEPEPLDKRVDKIYKLRPGPPEKHSRSYAKLPMKHKRVRPLYIRYIRRFDIKRARDIEYRSITSADRPRVLELIQNVQIRFRIIDRT